MKFITGINEIADSYNHLIIDLWGVLHDGHDPYKGAINALKKLKANNKKIVLLSNAPRRSIKAEATLDNLGFTKDMYDLLLTSGEVTFHYVKNNKELGKRYFYIGPDKDRHILEGLELEEVNTASQADFALATGFDGFGSLFSEKQYQLDDALEHKLHLIVANPDRKVVKQTGEEQICSGLMGEYYTEHGGQVSYFGKPYKGVYDECMQFFDTQDTGKVLCIGDSLHTDIAGANNIGAASILVAGGIHKKDLYLDDKIDDNQLRKLIDKENQRPTYIIEEFCW